MRSSFTNVSIQSQVLAPMIFRCWQLLSLLLFHLLELIMHTMGELLIFLNLLYFLNY